MQGMNIALKLYRAAQSADDVAGGATRGAYTYYGKGRGRVQQRAATLEMRATGLTADHVFDVFIQPANLGVIRTDVAVPQSGPFKGVRLYVTGVQTHTLAQTQGPHVHLRLQCERWDEGRVIDLQA